MADVKISALPASTTPLAGTEVLPIVQGTTTKQVAVSDLTAGRAVSALSVTSTNDASINGVVVGRGGSAIATNTAVGVSALAANTTGAQSVAIGYEAGKATTTSSTVGVTFVGYQAGLKNTTGYNDAFGNGALASVTTANGNAAFGYASLNKATSGNNSAFGFAALNVSTSSGQNTALGNSALRSNTTGGNNTAVGYNAGYGAASANANTTGNNNTYIGYQTVGSGVNNTNEMVIGYNAVGLGTNTTIIGNSSTTATYNGNNSATWSITSDARVKKNITSLASGLDVISALRPVEFDYISNDKHDVGFIAQEYQTVLPAQVIDQDNQMLGLNQNLTPYLVKALQELNEKFDAYVASHP
jgi:hypothetical protein